MPEETNPLAVGDGRPERDTDQLFLIVVPVADMVQLLLVEEAHFGW